MICPCCGRELGKSKYYSEREGKCRIVVMR